MNPRTFSLRLRITNDKGETAYYTVRPVAPPDLGAAVAGFLLTNFTKNPSPLYLVTLAADGQTSCSCPQFGFAQRCKHADTLTAAGVLPSAVISVLQDRTQALAAAEAESSASPKQPWKSGWFMSMTPRPPRNRLPTSSPPWAT